MFTSSIDRVNLLILVNTYGVLRVSFTATCEYRLLRVKLHKLVNVRGVLLVIFTDTCEHE